MIDWLKGLFSRRSQGLNTPERRELVSLRARYDAAQTTDENANLWSLTDWLSPKAANNWQVRRTLRMRARYEVANNSYARGITLTLANDLIGTGPRLQMRTGDRDLNKAVEIAFGQWAAAVGLADKLRVMALAKIQDGEAFGLFTTNRRIEAPVQLDVKLIEADQVTTPTPTYLGDFWVDGVTLNDQGEVIGYKVLKRHPGDLFLPTLNPLEWDEYRADLVLHWFRSDRPGQIRGIPEITPALELFGELRRFTRATLRAAETAADFAAVLETEAPAPGDDEQELPIPWTTQEISRGMMAALPGGAKLSQLTAQHPATTHQMFVQTILREIARCLNMPFNKAAGDSSGYNYSSGRLDHLDYHRSVRVTRADCERRVMEQVFRSWSEEAVMVPGYLPEGAVPANLPHRWFWDQFESIDPVKDAQAAQLELQLGLTTRAELCSERGEDWEEVYEQLAAEKDAAEELGLTFGTGQPAGTEGAGNEQEMA